MCTKSDFISPLLRLRLTLEEYDAVEREALPLLTSSRQEEAEQGRGALLISLRNQGRLNEAARLLRTGQFSGSSPPLVPVGTDYVHEALLSLESGDPGRAASFLDNRRRMEQGAQASGLRARWLAWNTALTATALAAVGDTVGGSRHGVPRLNNAWTRTRARPGIPAAHSSLNLVST